MEQRIKSIREEIKMEQQIKEETKEPDKLLCPKAGTATSSPAIRTKSSSNLKIVKITLFIKRN